MQIDCTALNRRHLRSVLEKSSNVYDLTIHKRLLFGVELPWVYIIISLRRFLNGSFNPLYRALINVHLLEATLSVFGLSRSAYAQFLRVILFMILFHNVRMEWLFFGSLYSFHLRFVNNLLLLKLFYTVYRYQTHLEFFKVKLIISV